MSAAIRQGGCVFVSDAITVAGDAVISQCSALLMNEGQGGGIFGANRSFVELRDRAQVIECQAEKYGGCIAATDILIEDRAHVGHCTAVNSLESGIGGCVVALSRIVITDFATLTHCYAHFSSAIAVNPLAKILLSGNAVVSDCTAVWKGAVVLAYINVTVILEDDATITRAYSGLEGTFHVQGDSSLLMTGRASIHKCVAAEGSAVFVEQGSLTIHGQKIKISNCNGVACCEPASL